MDFQNAWVSDRTVCFAETHFDSARILEGVLNTALMARETIP